MPFSRVACRGGVAPLGCERDGDACDLGLRVLAVPRQRLDHLAVAVARFEVHSLVDTRRVLAQSGFKGARLLDEALPVHLGEEPQHPDCALDADVRLDEPFLAGRLRVRRGEELVERSGEGLEGRNPQHHGKRPQLRDREGRLGLEGLDEGHEPGLVEVEAGRFDECTGEFQHPGPRSIAGVGESATKARGDFGRDLPDRARDEVVIVEKPLCGPLVVRVIGPRGAEAPRGARHRGRDEVQVQQRARGFSRAAPKWLMSGGERHCLFDEVQSPSGGRALSAPRAAWPGPSSRGSRGMSCRTKTGSCAYARR